MVLGTLGLVLGLSPRTLDLVDYAPVHPASAATLPLWVRSPAWERGAPGPRGESGGTSILVPVIPLVSPSPLVPSPNLLLLFLESSS